jgi:hypothetical protein
MAAQSEKLGQQGRESHPLVVFLDSFIGIALRTFAVIPIMLTP